MSKSDDKDDIPTMQDLAGGASQSADVPSMQDLISQAKVADQKAKLAKKAVRRGSRLLQDQRFSGQSQGEISNKMSTEFFGGAVSDRGSVLGSNAHESVEFGNMKRISMSQADMSEAGTDIVRKEMSQADYDKFNRLSTNKDLSGLTNQVLELILDNVKMTHMNQKLSEYCRSQGKRLEAHAAASVAEKAQA